jgi:hypothetical protein
VFDVGMQIFRSHVGAQPELSLTKG